MFNNSIFIRGVQTLWTDRIYRTLLLTIRFMSWRTGYHRRIGQLSPRVATIFFYLTKIWVRSVNEIGRFLNKNKYTDTDPYKRIYVNPNDIRLETASAARRRGWVEDGDWDQETNLFNSRTIPKAIHQRYIDDKPWNETDVHNKETHKKIERIHDSIHEHGYKSQIELIEESSEAVWKDLNDSIHPSVNEISIDIGRNGELLWNMCGQHRLTIAKVLDIDRVPVQVFRRHTEWQAIRNRSQDGTEIPEEYRNHPDLADLQ